MDEGGQDILTKRQQVTEIEADIAHSKKMRSEHSKAIRRKQEKQEIATLLDPSLQGVKRIFESMKTGRDGQHLLPADNGTFVLALRPNMSPHSLELTQLTKETDHIGYFNYDIMARRAMIYFDPESNEPVEVDVYDIDGMRQDKASQADSYRYRKDYDVGQLLEGNRETAQEVADYLQPMLEPLQETSQPPST